MKPSGHICDASTVESLATRRTDGLRRLALALGYPSKFEPTLSAILRNVPGAIDAEGEAELRRRLGLAPLPERVWVQPCASCRQVHGDGWDCQGAKVQLVRRRARPRRIQDITVAELRWAILHREEYNPL